VTHTHSQRRKPGDCTLIRPFDTVPEPESIVAVTEQWRVTWGQRVFILIRGIGWDIRMTESGETATAETVDEADEPDDGGYEDVDTTHLDGIDDGCGCAEVWEHLSDERDD